MKLLNTEHSPVAYVLDFVLYSAACLALMGYLWVWAPVGSWGPLAGWALLGAAGWTAREYALHRFVLHGLQPFARWHGEHHRRPAALIGTPTLVSAPLFGLLLALPAVWLLGPWRGGALTLGVLAVVIGRAGSRGLPRKNALPVAGVHRDAGPDAAVTLGCELIGLGRPVVPVARHVHGGGRLLQCRLRPRSQHLQRSPQKPPLQTPGPGICTESPVHFQLEIPMTSHTLEADIKVKWPEGQSAYSPGTPEELILIAVDLLVKDLGSDGARSFVEQVFKRYTHEKTCQPCTTSIEQDAR